MMQTRALRGKPDEINSALGTTLHWERYYDKALSVRILGPHSRDHVTVSRYYCTLKPPVVVDFEPSKNDGKLYLEEKRQYFMEKGVIYVPILLNETITQDQFRERLETASGITTRGGKILSDNKALGEAIPEEALPKLLLSPEVATFVDAEALRLTDAYARTKKKFGGAVRTRQIVKFKLQVVEDVKRAARQGRLAQVLGSRDLAVTMR